MSHLIDEPVTRKTRWRLRKELKRPTQPWCWPLPRLGFRDPVALRSADGGRRLAVDIGYNAVDVEARLFLPVYAVQDGMVRVALETDSGFEVTLDHGGQWSTRYAHLDRMFVIPQSGRRRCRFETVHAGTVIGYAAKAPVHCRFELWQWNHDRGYEPTDPLQYLPQWTIYGSDDRTPLPIATALATPGIEP